MGRRAIATISEEGFIAELRHSATEGQSKEMVQLTDSSVASDSQSDSSQGTCRRFWGQLLGRSDSDT